MWISSPPFYRWINWDTEQLGRGMWTKVCLTQKPKSLPLTLLTLKGLVGRDKISDSPGMPFQTIHSIEIWAYPSFPLHHLHSCSSLWYCWDVIALRCSARRRLKTTDLEHVASGEKKYPWIGQESDPAPSPPWQMTSPPPNPSCRPSAWSHYYPIKFGRNF